jgi:hypothetical protein
MFPVPDLSIEDLYSPLVRKRRLRLYALLQGRESTETIIKPTRKVGKGESLFFQNSIDNIFNRRDMQDFRGSKFRGISKNGSSW